MLARPTGQSPRYSCPSEHPFPVTLGSELPETAKSVAVSTEPSPQLSMCPCAPHSLAIGALALPLIEGASSPSPLQGR